MTSSQYCIQYNVVLQVLQTDSQALGHDTSRLSSLSFLKTELRGVKLSYETYRQTAARVEF